MKIKMKTAAGEGVELRRGGGGGGAAQKTARSKWKRGEGEWTLRGGGGGCSNILFPPCPS